jgi:uncharacterized protein YkwD
VVGVKSWTARIAVGCGVVLVACGSPQHITITNQPNPAGPKIAALQPGTPDSKNPLPAAAERYTTDRVDGAPYVGVRAADLSASFTTAWSRARGTSIEGDHRLAELALWLAQCDANHVEVDSKLITLGSQRLGIPFADPVAVQVTFSTGVDAERLVATLQQSIEPLPRNRAYARYGVGVTRDGDGLKGIVLVSMADVTLRPLPRKLPRGGELRLAGTLADAYAFARLSVTLPTGKVVSFQSTGKQFDGGFAVPETGIYQVELLGDGATGPVVVANFPIYVDSPEPEAPSTTRNATEDQNLTAAQIEEILLGLVNGERAKSSLPAVKKSDELAEVATGHSRDMVDHAFFAHVSPTTGTTEERVMKSKLPLISLGENIAEGSNVQEIHQSLLKSPAHRAVIIDPQFTHVGIGVVVRGVEPRIVATEVFGELRPIDAAKGGADIVEQLSMARLTRGLSAIRDQPHLRLLAQQGLELRLRDPSTPSDAVARSVAAETKAQGPALARAGIRSTAVVVLEARSVQEAISASTLYATNVKYAGVAVEAQPAGARPAPQLVVIVLGGP